MVELLQSTKVRLSRDTLDIQPAIETVACVDKGIEAAWYARVLFFCFKVLKYLPTTVNTLSCDDALLKA